MPDIARFMTQPGQLLYYRNGGLVSVTDCASRQVLFEKRGYNGKKVNSKPPPIHPFVTYNDDNTLYMHDWLNRPGWGTRQYEGHFLAAPRSAIFTPAPDFSAVYNKALDKLNEQTRGSLDLLIDIAEYKSTAQMFNATNRVQSYHQNYVDQFNRKGKKTETFLKFLGNHWLEYTYGITPLMSSLFGVLNERIRVANNALEHFRVRATDSGYRPETVRFRTIYGDIDYAFEDGEFKLSTTIGVSLEPRDFSISRWMSLNPLSIAWELTPYSFVADWFIDVGGYIRNLETGLLYGNRFNTGYVTNLVVHRGTVSEFYDYRQSYPDATSDSHQLVTGTFRGSSIVRNKLTNYPLPSLPKFQAELGSSRLLSLAALMTQQLGKRPTKR